jgi:uncharacterized membrane protein YhaH (DUF805 family)
LELRKWFFSFHGRINRSEFWILMLIAFAFAIAIVFLSFIPVTAVRIPVAFALVLAALAVFLAAATRRLHDRDKSAWFLLLYFGAPSLIQTAKSEEQGTVTFSLFSGGFGSFFEILSLAISVWTIVELGCLQGTPGVNRYGPVPLKEPADEPLRD